MQTRSPRLRRSAEAIARPELYAGAGHAVFAWGMGMTIHAHGVANIEWLSNLALMRGMVGRRNAGLLPLRGRSNVQGIGTIGVKPVLPEKCSAHGSARRRAARATGLHTLAALEAAHANDMDAACSSKQSL